MPALKVPTATEAAEKIELWTELVGKTIEQKELIARMRKAEDVSLRI